MTTFREQDHPRARGGKFAVKEQPEATTVTLECDPADMATPETFEMLWCESCSVAFDEAEAAALYECDSCGTKGPENRCDQCHKFRARSEAPGCPQCEEPVDESPVEMVQDHDGATIRVEDFDPDGASLAERTEQAKAEAAVKAEADRVARLAQKQQSTALLTAADIGPGAVLINPDDDSRFATEAEVLSVRRVETPDGPIVIFKTYEYSHRTLVRRAGDLVPTKTDVTEYPTQTRGGTRLTAADFGGARLIDGFDPQMQHISSPSRDIDVLVGSSARDHGTLPTLALMLGRRGTSGNLSGSVSYLGRWDDPEVAAAALDEFEKAADALAAARAEHPPTPRENDEERDRNRLGTALVREVDWVSAEVQRTAQMTIGLADWEPENGAVMAVRSDSVNVAIDDPTAMKKAVVEARKHLHTLTGIPARPDIVDDKI